MKKFLLAAALLVAVSLAMPSPAAAGFSLSIGVPGFALFAGAPCPPRVHYAPPAYYYAPPVVSFHAGHPGHYYSHSHRYHRHGWKHGHYKRAHGYRFPGRY
jgi:hypothetical protein